MRLRGDYDVIVCGGGTAGAIAAIAAARTGANTLLVEQYGRLGGTLSYGMSFKGTVDAEGYRVLGGIGRELLERVRSLDGVTLPSIDPMFGSIQGQDPELLKLILMYMVKEAGVKLLLHTFIADVLLDRSRVKGIVVANKAGLEVITGKYFVDCTGDADIVSKSNGAFIFGRPEDSLTQPVSSIIRVGGVDVDKTWDYLDSHPEDMSTPDGWSGEPYKVGFLRHTPGAVVEGFRSLILKAEKSGDYHIPRDRMGMDTLPGRDEVVINITRLHEINGTDPDDVTKAEIETQLQVLEVIQFLRHYVPGFENSYVISTPVQVGVRETRHIKGAYELTKDDIMSGRDFDDQIGRGAYPLDIHDVKANTNVLGNNVAGGGVTLWKIKRSYGIPARCLIPLGVDNVIVGGRSISATHEAAGSIRGQSVCMVTGHAAGVMAALAALRGMKLDALPVPDVQEVLRSQEAVIERNIQDIQP